MDIWIIPSNAPYLTNQIQYALISYTLGWNHIKEIHNNDFKNTTGTKYKLIIYDSNPRSSKEDIYLSEYTGRMIRLYELGHKLGSYDNTYKFIDAVYGTSDIIKFPGFITEQLIKTLYIKGIVHYCTDYLSK